MRTTDLPQYYNTQQQRRIFHV